MRTLLNLVTLLIMSFAQMTQNATAQEYINPIKNLSVTRNMDTLIFRELNSERLLSRFVVSKGSASRYLKFSPSGNYMITSGDGQLTNLYRIEHNAVKLISSMPFLTREAIFDGRENTVFFMHAAAFKLGIDSYAINPWKKLCSKPIPSGSHGLTINASGSLLAFCGETDIRILRIPGMRIDRVCWKMPPQRLLAFNPAEENQIASVNTANHIQIFDIQKDSMLMEINKHTSDITWIGFDPSGKLLSSLDKDGYLFTWIPAQKQCIAGLKGLGGNPVFGPDATLNLSLQNAENKPGFIHAREKIPDSLWQPVVYPRTGHKTGSLYKLPIIGYRSGEGFRAGLGLRYIFSSGKEGKAEPLSFVAAKLAYGFKNRQLTAAVEADVYAIKAWRMNGKLAYSLNELDYYFGVGGASSKNNKLPYATNSLLFNGRVLRSVLPKFGAGAGFSVQHNTPIRFEGLTRPVTEGNQGGWLAGFGPVLQFDSRNSILFPSGGMLMEATFLNYGLAGLGDYSYRDLKLDIRKYFAFDLFTKGSVFAFQVIYNGTWGGSVPFYKLPYITGERALRGIWRNLYIDQQVFSLQGEYRSFFSPHNDKYGYVFFAGMGDGAGNFFKAYRPDLKFIYGTGFRMQVIPKRKLDFRLDLSLSSKGDVGIYAGTGVSF